MIYRKQVATSQYTLADALQKIADRVWSDPGIVVGFVVAYRCPITYNPSPTDGGNGGDETLEGLLVPNGRSIGVGVGGIHTRAEGGSSAERTSRLVGEASGKPNFT